MEVKINIEASQLGETILDLFNNLTPEDKKELTLSILREWLQSPVLFETENKQQQLIEEYRENPKRLSCSWKYNEDNKPSVNNIKNDYNFQKELDEYKNSKQVMVESIRNEVVSYYKELIKQEVLKDTKGITKAQNKILEELSTDLPKIINQTLLQTFVNMFQNSYGITSEIINRLNLLSSHNSNMNLPPLQFNF